MSEEIPSFSTKNIDENIKKQVNNEAPLVKKKKAIRRKTGSAKSSKNNLEKKAENKISENLTSIYQDNNGQLPNMTRIKIKKNHPVFKFFFTLIIVGGFLAAIAWVGFFFMPNSKKFSEEKVSLTISGPTEITLGATSTYVINYKNDQNTKLKNATLSIQYPKGFAFISSNPTASNSGHTEWNLGDIAPQQTGNVSIVGNTYGIKGQAESWRVLLTYQPENFAYKSQKIITENVELKKEPLLISISGPDKITVGNETKYNFKIEKKDKLPLNQIELTPAWSTNFFITSSTPTLSKNNKWLVDLNTTTNNWVFSVTGRFASSTQEQAKITLKASTIEEQNKTYYQLAESSLTTQLVQTKTNLNLTVNKSGSNFSVKPGDDLEFSFNFKNTGTEELKNLTAKLSIDAPSAGNRSILDWPSIKDKYDGDIVGTQINNDTRRGDITWTSKHYSDLASLKPDKDISVGISLPLRDIDQFDLADLNTYQIKINAQISYKDAKGVTQNIYSNPIMLTINSDLSLEVRDTASVNSSGLTEHKIKWVLTNNFHPLKNIVLTADAYGDINWLTDVAAPAGEIKFDLTTKKITWSIASMPESVDVLAMPFTITVNKINPSQNLLVSKVKVEAEDEITKEKITLTGNEIKLQ